MNRLVVHGEIYKNPLPETADMAQVVYVIDDDPGVLQSMAFLLRSLGFEFKSFADAGQFLEAIDGLQPGCIVTDLRMPGMDGFELLGTLVDRSVGWPIVLMTSENGSLNAGAAADRGFCGFLRKPFSPEDLAAVLEACLARLGALED